MLLLIEGFEGASSQAGGFSGDMYNMLINKGHYCYATIRSDDGRISGVSFKDSNGFGFGYNDMTVVKAGYEWDQNDTWTFRVGYSITNQPIESSEVIFNILAPAVIEDHLTAGFTKSLSDDSEITMSFMYGAGEKVTGANPFDPGQMISIDMDQFQIGFTYSKK